MIEKKPYPQEKKMNIEQILDRIKQLGAQAKGKAQDASLKLSLDDLDRLRQEIGLNQETARKLWETGNAEARALALKLTDKLSLEEAEAWLKELSHPVQQELMAKLAAKSDWAREALARWTKDGKEYAQATGYSLLEKLLEQERELQDKAKAKLTGEEAQQYLERIESGLHQAAGQAKSRMAEALVALGVYREELRDAAMKAAERLGQPDEQAQSLKERLLKALERFKH